ncbi:MAG: hypothetical protein GYB55_18490 [Cytophagales bacterium]|nr:hypothetical protein [Cytophagales bacterium]
MKFGKHKIGAFLTRVVLTNLLAIFLISLSVAEGEKAMYNFPSPGFEIGMLDYDYLDFPTSLTRTFTNYSPQKNALLPTFYLKAIDFKSLIITSLNNPKRICTSAPLRQLKRIISLVICKNAP